MFAHRNFVHRRSHNGARPNFADAQSNPVLSPVNTPSASSLDPQKTNTFTPPTSTTPDPTVSQTTDAPTTSSSPSSSSSATVSTPTSTPTSSPSSSSSSATSSVVSSASHTPATSSTSSTPLVVSSPSISNGLTSLPVTTQVITGISFTPTASLAPSATSSAGSSGRTNTGAIVGGVAGTLAGIAAIGLILMWCMRRQRNRDIDDFDAQAFKRQSAMLVDDPVDPLQSYNPRPPTMFERHNASPALAAQAGYGGQNFYGNYGGYSQQPAYPPEMAQPPMGYAGYDDPRQQITSQPSNMGYADYDSQQQLARQPSNAQYLTRQPSSAAGYAPSAAPPSSLDPNAHYVDLNRSSVTPYQAVQYADISRHLGTTDPNEQVAHQHSELPDDPLPSPFDDPVEPNVVPVVARGTVTTTPAQAHGHAAACHQRPATVYEEGDAYSGI